MACVTLHTCASALLYPSETAADVAALRIGGRQYRGAIRCLQQRVGLAAAFHDRHAAAAGERGAADRLFDVVGRDTVWWTKSR